MTRSLVRRISGLGVAALAAALAVVGASTGAWLHVHALGALDDALLAAAHVHVADGDVHHFGPDIETWVATPEDGRVPPRILARAAEGAEPFVKDQGDRRLLLLPVGTASDEVLVVGAWAPRVTVARSIGGFLGAWFLASALIVVVSASAVSAVVRRALRPLAAARADVTRVVALGQGLRVSEAAPLEVEPLLRAVNALLDRLEAAHALQVRFTADAAHELRTPVTALLGQIDVALLKEEASDPALLVSLRQGVVRLRALVEALSALVRVDAGEIEASREPVRAREIAEAALEIEREALAKAGCRVTLHLDDDPELEAHTVLLELAVGNLLRNAAAHAPGADVTLTLRREGPRAVFEVRDTGPGIPEDEVEALFGRFARGRVDEGRRVGLGLGLPLAREVARRHGGDCVLRPVPDGGIRAILEVRLPEPRMADSTCRERRS